MFPFLLALIVFALAGAGATAWLRREPPKGNDLLQGLDYLAGLRWADFIRLVLRAMHAAGYSTIGDDGKPNDGFASDGKDILLKRGAQRTLLFCKHGSSSIVSAQAVLGLGKSAQLRGATASIVVTPGRFDAEARRVATQQQVELIDGEHLWPKVKPFIPEQSLPSKSKAASPKAPLMAWAAAALLGVVSGLLAYSMQAPIEPTTDPNVSASQVTARNHATDARSYAPATADIQPIEQVPTDAAELDQRRREAANSISTLFGVQRAAWSTQSTLQVNLSSADADPVSELCPLLERYPELAASRVQLQPPPGSDRAVRFIQCRSY
ncbi:MAG: restriction endonuclease [Thermomonas sp.]